MPGFYSDGEYDIAGFIVGLVDRPRIIDGKGIHAGDVLIGLPSAGLHTNGYSLARAVFFEQCGWTADTVRPELGCSVGDALLTEHRSYLQAVTPLLDARLVKGMAHITGGGITENLPRMFPPGVGAEIDTGSWHVPPLFRLLQSRGGIATDEMFRAFNMGIGLVIVCAEEHREEACALLARQGEAPILAGDIVAGEKSVRYRNRS
jgi:phosphoribosylformylglycinamidine cyclo-ligase